MSVHIESTLAPAIPGCTVPSGIQPGCEPFALLNGHSRVVVFLHGLTGTPLDFRAFSDAYTNQFDVIAPLMPGHATRFEDLERLTYADLSEFIPALSIYLREHYEEIHVCGLSYGAIPMTNLALEGGIDSLSLFAPAFFLLPKNERSMRLVRWFRLDFLRSRVAKSNVHPPRPDNQRQPGGENETFAYTDIPVRPAMGLHRQAQRLRKALPASTVPLFYAHGDRDGTTPLAANRDFILGARSDTHFYLVEGGEHVITLGPAAKGLRQEHLNWLQGLNK